MSFVIAGSSLRLVLMPNEGLVVTSDGPVTVVNVATSAVIPGLSKAGKDTRSRWYGPVSIQTEVAVTATQDADAEVFRGSIVVHGRLEIVTMKAEELASPTPEILATTDVTYQLDVSPYTRWRSDGTRLVQEVDSLLTGLLSGPALQIASTDTLFEALAKLQAQINAGGGGGGGSGLLETTSLAALLETTTGAALIES